MLWSGMHPTTTRLLTRIRSGKLFFENSGRGPAIFYKFVTNMITVSKVITHVALVQKWVNDLLTRPSARA